jgi:ABC-type lipoprotein release transport system permease subunit
MMSVISLLVRLGLQSVRAHKRKSLIVGGLMGFGAFLVVTGTALLNSVEASMRTSIVSSVTGDIQVYEKDAKDALALFGGFGFGSTDNGELKEVKKVEDFLMGVPNVKAVVPMGIANGTVSTPGDLDRALNLLRDAVRNNDQAGREAAASKVRRIAGILQEQRKRNSEVSRTPDDVEAEATLARATSDELWAEFQKDPLTILDELDGKLAPLGEQGQIIYLRMVGTDLTAFQKNFDKMKVLSGQMVPPGERGLLIGQKFLDRRVKMAISMNLDTIHDDRAKGKTIATDKVLQETVTKNVHLWGRIVTDLNVKDAAEVEGQLRKLMPESKAKDLSELLQDYLKMDDSNFEQRYAFFNDVIGPKLQLYPFKVGDTITLTSFTQTGYLRSVNVKIWGTYAFEGLESSDLAGALSLVDIMTFRDLYGARTEALDAELAAMKKDVGASNVNREDAEAALFGGDSAGTVEEVKPVDGGGADPSKPRLDEVQKIDRAQQTTFTQADVDNGLAISVAVLLKDPSKIKTTIADINKLGEPMGLQAVDWQAAAGLIGQFVWVIRGVLTIAILIIFAVAIVIINNSMVMATLERVAEIGTMRAIGAQKNFVTSMIIFEMGVLGVIAGGVGVFGSFAFLTWLHSAGIPAGNDILTFLFAGPRLYPTVTVLDMLVGLLATLIVSVAATLYPARLATGVSPVVAMQGKE